AARFSEDGSVTVGLPAVNRYMDIAYADEVEVEELLDPDVYERRRRQRYDSFYGKSWALYHFLTMERERRGQVGQYIQLMGSGKTSREAALEAFGAFADLDKDIDSYLRRRQLVSPVFRPEQLVTGAIAVRRLGEGEAEMVPVRVRPRRGVDAEEAAALVVQPREIAARHPGEAPVLA